MKVFSSRDPHSARITILARAEGPGMLGDLIRVLNPGETFLGIDHAGWLALGDGEHEIGE